MRLPILGLLILLSTKQLVGRTPINSPFSNTSISSVRFLIAVNVTLLIVVPPCFRVNVS